VFPVVRGFTRIRGELNGFNLATIYSPIKLLFNMECEWTLKGFLNLYLEKKKYTIWSRRTIGSISTCKGIGLTKEGITRWFHKMRKNLFVKNSMYFGRLYHHLKLMFRIKVQMFRSYIELY
jgi:hypothetical protein